MLLWNRLAAVAPIEPLAWELPYVMSVVLKKKGGGNKPLRQTESSGIFNLGNRGIDKDMLWIQF